MRHAATRSKRWLLLTGVLSLVAISITLFTGGNVSANHPVFVEGNCDSPVPGTTLVAPGTCGDFDGDGRIGTAEDTDGADRIFGTLNAAIGAGTGAAAGTGANNNGRVIIVASGRFAEQIVLPSPAGGAMGNMQIEAAPGVFAVIDAVLQGDPAGGNTTRQNGIGITVNYQESRTVTLRNLVVSNFAEGLRADGAARVHLDHCFIENNLNFGLHAAGAARLTVSDCRIISTGFRQGAGGVSTTPNPGNAIQFDSFSGGAVVNSTITNSSGAALANMSTNPNIRTNRLATEDNDGGAIVGNPIIVLNSGPTEIKTADTAPAVLSVPTSGRRN